MAGPCSLVETASKRLTDQVVASSLPVALGWGDGRIGSWGGSSAPEGPCRRPC